MSGSGIEYIPKGYAERAIDDLVFDPNHGLFEDPGLGKTAQTLAAYKELRDCLDVTSALVIAPLRVCYSVWPAESRKWKQFRDLRVVNLHAGERGVGDIFLCNPEHLKKLFGQRDPDNPRKWIPGYWRDWTNRPDLLIIDESSKFKRISGTRYKTLKRYFKDFGRRQILTGSPAPNGYEDLHGQLTILDGGRSLEDGAALDPRIGHYRKQYFTPISTGPHAHDISWKLRPGSAEDILEAIAPRITCLRAEDWLDLPELIQTDIMVSMPVKAHAAYGDMEDEALCDLPDGTSLLVAEEAAVGKLRQICNGFVYDEAHNVHRLHDAKLDALDDLLAEIGSHPTMIVYEFKADYEVIRRRVKGAHIGAGVSPKEGAKIADAWNAKRISRLFVQPQSMSHGLNLQDGGSRVIWFGTPWDLELYKQLNARLFRQGQEADRVMIYHLVAAHTVEVRIGKVLRKKDATEADMKAALAEETDK